MSSKTPMTDDALDSVQQLRKEMSTLFNEHWENDLTEGERNVVTSFKRRMRFYPWAAGAVGFGLGFLAAHRFRTRSTAILQAFRAHQRPLHAVFPSGKTGKNASKPNLVNYLIPFTNAVISQ